MANVKKPKLPKPAADASKTVELECGVATEMWLELKAYPEDSYRSLWLLVDGTWLRLDDPDAVQDSVQAAFCNCPDSLEVLVWYQKNNPDPDYHPGDTAPVEGENQAWYGTRIEGLVIRSK